MTENFLDLEGVTYLGITKMFTENCERTFIAFAVLAVICVILALLHKICVNSEGGFLVASIISGVFTFCLLICIIAFARPVTYTDIRVDGSNSSAKYILENFEVRKVEGTKWTVRYVQPKTFDYVEVKIRIDNDGKVVSVR